MNKLIAILGVLVIVGCGESYDRANAIKGDSSVVKVQHFEYEGHKYIQFGNYRGGFVHDPDCECK